MVFVTGKHSRFARKEMHFFATCVYSRGDLRARSATQRNSLRRFNLWLIGSPFGQGLWTLARKFSSRIFQPNFCKFLTLATADNECQNET